MVAQSVTSFAASATLGTEADAIVQRCIDAGSTADEARRQILDALAARSAETATRSQARIETVRDETETTRRRPARAETPPALRPREARGRPAHAPAAAAN